MPLSIYDVLRKLVRGDGFRDFERAEVLDMIGELERLNVFGTLAGQVEASHECQPYQSYRRGVRCQICERIM